MVYAIMTKDGKVVTDQYGYPRVWKRYRQAELEARELTRRFGKRFKVVPAGIWVYGTIPPGDRFIL